EPAAPAAIEPEVLAPPAPPAPTSSIPQPPAGPEKPVTEFSQSELEAIIASVFPGAAAATALIGSSVRVNRITDESYVGLHPMMRTTQPVMITNHVRTVQNSGVLRATGIEVRDGRIVFFLEIQEQIGAVTRTRRLDFSLARIGGVWLPEKNNFFVSIE